MQRDYLDTLTQRNCVSETKDSTHAIMSQCEQVRGEDKWPQSLQRLSSIFLGTVLFAHPTLRAPASATTGSMVLQNVCHQTVSALRTRSGLFLWRP